MICPICKEEMGEYCETCGIDALDIDDGEYDDE